MPGLTPQAGLPWGAGRKLGLPRLWLMSWKVRRGRRTVVEIAQRIGGRGAGGLDTAFPVSSGNGSFLAWLGRFLLRRALPVLLIGAVLVGVAFLGLRAGEGLAAGDLAADGQPVSRGALSPDGSLVATLRDDGSVDVRAAAGGTGFIVRGHGAPVIEARFSEDGGSLITVDRDGLVVTTRLEGEPLARLSEGLHGVASPESLRSAVWNSWTQVTWRAGRELEHRLGASAAAARIMDASAPGPVLAAGVRPAPGTMFRDCADCPQMVVLPAGKFMMGSPATEEGRSDDEGPQREVILPAPFAAGRFEVTVGEFRRFLVASGHAAGGGCYVDPDGDGKYEALDKADWAGPGFQQDDSRPVACVSWNDAQAYARWLSRETGQTYRLLSEAEWEYAARAGTTTSYPWGAAASHDYANYGKDACCAGLASGRDKWVNTAPVGSFSPNASGLFDMHGNVWEWVEDCYAETYSAGQPSNGDAFLQRTCSIRVSRGGAWVSYPRDLRSAYRIGNEPSYRSSYLGVRVARTLFSTP